MDNRASNAHGAVVDAWLKGADGFSAEAVLDVFEAGLERMLRRAQPTLGEVTVGAIVDRVLYTAAERHPFLSPLEVSGGTVKFDALRSALGAVDPGELTVAARFALVEFLTVLGKLTAEILTPALHAELSQPPDEEVRPEPSRRKTKT